MVAGLPPLLEQADLAFRILRSPCYHPPEVLFRHVVGAGTRDQDTFGLRQANAEQIDILVPCQRTRDRLFTSGKGRRIQKNQVVASTGPFNLTHLIEGIG